MKSNYLSKSDFKAAFDCGTVLYYRKTGHRCDGHNLATLERKMIQINQE
jgi:hypothetical protein